MTDIVLQDITEADYDRLVEINRAEIQHTSPMDRNRLQELVSYSCFAKAAVISGKIVAFVLAMRENAPYVNANYLWFSKRYSQFLYIDRIVVAREQSGMGLGSRMYREVFQFAATEHLPLVGCEINVIPPNPASHKFHEKLGFREVGRQWLADNSKQVSMQIVEIV